MGTPAPVMSFTPAVLLNQVDTWRREASARLDPAKRSEFGQFLTPSPIASFMASLFTDFGDEVRLLDAGAGGGALLTAATIAALNRKQRPRIIEVTGFEIDPILLGYLRRAVDELASSCREAGVDLKGRLVEHDFIEATVEDVDRGLFSRRTPAQYTHAILNPPYRKLNSKSASRLLLRRAGIETSNIYTAFVALAIQRLAPGGELVAITPRSFCNGPYFKPFREFLLREMAIQRIHVFDSRTAAFSEDEVLQENVIFHAVKGAPQRLVTVSSSPSPRDEPKARQVPFAEIVHPRDRESFIHLVPNAEGQDVATAFAALACNLRDIGLGVSTGKVVDFRAKWALRGDPGPGIGPLIYPTHFAEGRVRWPKQGKKPNGLLDDASTEELWMPSGTYVLVKRFSAKEERRRVVAVVFDPEDVPGKKVGFENHLNVFHVNGGGIGPMLARGLAAFLNSTLTDRYFRQFNGHTQVNATDLRNLRYPAADQLLALGKRLEDPGCAQEELDELVADVIGFDADGRPCPAKNKRSS
ncbi:MAG TPA: Eco57I restriction-modification methylase domain-containing protein [Polyangiaceae bacterium]|nr:Eco57I restriction-modification methylase domain-containing protein [Polyangiaceae bacterium]